MVGNSEVASDFGRSFTKNKDEQQAQFSTNQYANVHVMIDDVHRSLHAIVQAITAQDLQVSRARCISTEWQNIGNVLDRFFFCLYVAVIIGSLITLSPKPQNTTFFWQDPWAIEVKISSKYVSIKSSNSTSTFFVYSQS